MNKILPKLLAIVLLSSSTAYSSITVLNCKSDFINKYFYIDTNKKKVGYMYLDKNEKNYIIYDWWYKNPKFAKNTISINDPETIGGYNPKVAWIRLIEIDRVNLRTRYYSKKNAIYELKQNYKYMPNFLIKPIVENFSDWKFFTSEKCDIISIPKNIKFISKEEYSINSKNSKPKAKF